MVYMSKMDADIQQQIRHEVVNAVAQSQNALMSQLKDLISNEMGKVQDQQQRIAETQITKLKRRCRTDISSNSGEMRNNINTTTQF